MLAREKEGKEFGVIVMAEGLAEFLPSELLQGVPRDEHGHIAISAGQLRPEIRQAHCRRIHSAQTGKSRKVTGLQLGYEARCAAPHAFDVMLGSQFGVGAYRALVEKRLRRRDGVGRRPARIALRAVRELVDPETLVTVVRYVDRESDFHKLARFLETYVE